jgi:hypothetical protein
MSGEYEYHRPENTDLSNGTPPKKNNWNFPKEGFDHYTYICVTYGDHFSNYNYMGVAVTCPHSMKDYV